MFLLVLHLMAFTFTNDLVSFVFDEAAAELTITGLAATRLDDETVDTVLNRTELILKRNLTFKSYWDLRNVAVPTLSTTARCVRWAWRNKQSLDALNTRMLVLLPGGSDAMLRVVNLVLRAFGPTCPVLATADETEGLSWWRRDQTSPTRANSVRL